MTEKLAIDGGKPAVPENLVAHNWERFRKSTPEEIAAVVEVLKSGHLSIAMGKGMPNAEALEKEFAEYIGTKYALAVNSGTASLHCAVAGVGIEPGDEVIVPAYTFIASAMAVLHQNAIPVFADVHPDTFVIDPTDVERKISSRTKGIMAVQMYGLPCDMDQIGAIAKKHNLKVVEDAAQAIGATYNGKKAGSLGDAAGFSFCTTKQLMAGEGGIMTTNDRETYEKAGMLRLFGERCDMNAPDRAYISEGVGWNYKMAETISALARVKLSHIDDYIGITQKNAAHLSTLLADIEGLQSAVVPADRTHACYMYPVRVRPESIGLDVPVEKFRNAILQALVAENVRVSLWQNVPVPAQTIFQRKAGYGKGCPWNCKSWQDVSYDPFAYPNTIRMLQDHFVVWGLIPPSTSELMDYYSQAFHKVFANCAKLVEIYDRTETYQPLEQRLDELTKAG